MRGPGSGAEEQARRSAEQVAQERAALAAQQRRLAAAEARHHAWSAGAEGERATAAALQELAADGWLLLHDVHWPGRPVANLDHVAVGPGGVVVVDAKNWSTPVRVRDGVLWAGRHAKTRDCEAAASAAAAVGALLRPQHRHLARAAICLVQQDLDGTRVEAGVVAVGLRRVAAAIRSMPGVLAPAEVRALHAHLTQWLGAPVSPAQLTTAALGRRPVARAARARPRATTSQRQAAWRPARRRRALVGLVVAVVALWGYPQLLGSLEDAVRSGTEQQVTSEAPPTP